jgi:hypothetical protein
MPLTRPQRQRTERYHRWLPGRELARMDTAYDDQITGYSRIWWMWSLRSTGEAWHRKLRVEYKEQRADGTTRYIPARRKEPVIWTRDCELTDRQRARIARGEETPAQVLAAIVLAAGHYPVGMQPERLPAEPPAGSLPPVPKPTARREPAGDVINFGPSR